MAQGTTMRRISSTQSEGMSFASPLSLMLVLYFGIGFVTALNDLLVPHFMDLFHLSNVSALLVQFSFFGAYFVMSMPSGRLIRAIGYQPAIVLALVLMGTGLFLFVPASYVSKYWVFLAALFVVGSGLALLQVAINPYVGALGNPETAAARLNLAGGFNSLAGTLAPRLGSALIFVAAGASAADLARSVRLPYLLLSSIAFAMALAAYAVRLPKLLEETNSEAPCGSDDVEPRHSRHLRAGAMGIFAYVGAEVAIGSLMISFLGQPSMGGLNHAEAAGYVSLYWGGAMIGRFAGALVLQRVRAQHALAFSACMALIAVALAMTQHGLLAVAALVSCGLFNSIMWPCIFLLSLKGLGSETSRGSGLLVMMVVGGAIVPEVQGYLADRFGYEHSFLVVWICYAYVLYFSLRAHRDVQEEVIALPVATPVETV